MNKEFKNDLQDIIIADADDGYMLSEGIWDKFKARTAGAVAGAKQVGTNLKNKAKGLAQGAISGWKNEPADEKMEDIHSTSGDAVEKYEDVKLETWKNSMLKKFDKFTQVVIKKVEELVEEAKKDGEDLGVDQDVLDLIDSKKLAIINASKSLSTNMQRIFMNKEEVRQANLERDRERRAAKPKTN